MAAFAAAALLLAVTGIYAVIMYSVTRRSREIGIRVALGAPRLTIVRLVMGEGARFIGAGLVAGVLLAAAVMRTLSATLFGLTASDPATFAEVAAVVAGASLIACAVPTMRALRLGTGRIHAE